MSHIAHIANQEVGAGRPAFLVAELGVTHEASLSVAEEMIRAAKHAGFNAVKVECIDADRLVATDYRSSIQYSFNTLSGVAKSINYHELLKQVSLDYDEISQLASIARSLEMPFFGTAFDIDTCGFLKSIGACAIKISSGEIDHFPLLEAAAKTGLPVFFDSGRASVVEVLAAVEVLNGGGCLAPIIMHNPSGYPAPPRDVCLETMDIYRRATALPVGFSCHTRGNVMVHAAVAVGANVIEKPVSRDNTVEEDEHIFSINMHELDAFVQEVRSIEASLVVDLKKLIHGGDEIAKTRFRQSVAAARDLQAGQKLEISDLTFARPGFGIRPGKAGELVGRQLRDAVAAGVLLLEKHFVD